MAQYRRAAQSRGYSPRRVDQSNIQRMREDSERTARNMRERAETEISERRRTLAQQKEDQAATRRMEEKNFAIQTQNSNREIEGLRLQAQRDANQAAIDIKASNQIFQSIAQFSDTAVKVLGEEKKQQDALQYQLQTFQGMFGEDSGKIKAETQDALKENAVVGLERHTALLKAEEAGGLDPYTRSQVANREETELVQYGLSQTNARIINGTIVQEANARVEQVKTAIEEQGGVFTYEDAKKAIGDVYRQYVENLHTQRYPTHLAVKVLTNVNTQVGQVLKTHKKQFTDFNNEQSLQRNISIFQDSAPEDLPIVFPGVYRKLLWHKGGKHSEVWKELMPSMTAVDQKTGNPIMDMDTIMSLPTTDVNGKTTTVGERFTNSQGQAVGVLADAISGQNKNMAQWQTNRDKVEKAANEQLEDQLTRVAIANPTAQNIGELQRQYVELTGGEQSERLTNISKTLSVEVQLRNNRAQELLSKNDEDITQADVDAMQVVGSDEQKKTFKSRYENGPGQYRTKEAQSIIDNATAVIKGQTTFGTTKRALTGQQVAISYMEQQIRIRARQYYGDGNNGYTVEEALTKAADDEKDLFDAQKDTKNYKLAYAVKNEPNADVSFPFLEGRAGNVAAAEREYRDYQKMRSMVKMIGFQEVANVPHSIFSAERLEYILQNSDKPGFKYKTSELGFQGLSAGSPMHDIVNAQLAAAGRSERISAPAVLSGITIPPEQQSIINDARRSYQAKLNAINVASGNTAVYREPSYMRPGSPLVASAGPNNPTPRQAYDYMLELGVSDTHAKGILANIQGESGFQTGVMGDNGMSGGLFQMYDDRYRKMERAVPNWRANWKGQIKHALQDDRAPEYLQMQFNSPEEAADWFLENYERPAMSHRSGRRELNRSFIPNLGF